MATPLDVEELREDVSQSPLYSEDLAPVPAPKRTWDWRHLAALWVGMAVCIPTYLLASYMVTSGMAWHEALIIIGIANVIITVPMVLNGHAGVKYGIPFPVLGRSAFGIYGIHIPAIVRGIVACGWFGVQTWIGGLAIYAIGKAAMHLTTGAPMDIGTELSAGKFVAFGIFWLINLYFIWNGTESIRKLEAWSAPILVLIGVLLIGWGWMNAGNFGTVLLQSEQLAKPSVSIVADPAAQQSTITLHPLRDVSGNPKATEVLFTSANADANQWNLDWMPIEAVNGKALEAITPYSNAAYQNPANDASPIGIQFRGTVNGTEYTSSQVVVAPAEPAPPQSKLRSYLFWLTVMLGFWATMSLSIADITRYAKSQADQVKGQFVGLPGTMVLYSFAGIFVTCAAVINFDSVLIANDAPWDPVALLAKFESPWVVILAQLAMLVATLSTNIAANVIAPANAFSNVAPKLISFRTGGIITAVLGIVICPWLLLGTIADLLIFVSGFLGPVLGILLADYFALNKKQLNLTHLYKVDGLYTFAGGFRLSAIAALVLGILPVLLGYYDQQTNFANGVLVVLYEMSWFTGFGVAFVSYILLSKRPVAAS